MIPIDIQVSRSKVKPIFDKFGKGGISVSQTSIFVDGLYHARVLPTHFQNSHIV